MMKSDYSSELEEISLIFDPDRRIPLDLHFPSHQPVPSNPDFLNAAGETAYASPSRPRAVTDRSLRENCRPIGLALTAWITSLIFTVVYSLFIYHVLFEGNPVIGSWTFDASLTNLLLSLLSQLYAMLLAYVVLSLSDALRWSLASRSGRVDGASASSFFQLSPATDWFSTMKFIFKGRFRSNWGVISFEDYFIKQGVTVDVYAGNIPPDVSILGLISTAYLDGFFDTWTQQLLNYPRYATTWKMKGCTEDCSVSFLPGGMEIARKVGPLLNSTILKGGLFNNTESIMIQGAPGMVARFEPVADGFEFDIEEDCNVYQTPLGDALQMCKKQFGDSVAAGWRACPSFFQFTRACATQLSWTRAPLVSKTLFTAYRQNATTTYSQKDLSIQHAEPISEPVRVKMSVPDMDLIWNRIFVPRPLSSQLDLESINITIARMAWKYRTYTEFFPDNEMHVELLQNFLSVPLQFAITAMQYANYTLALPADKRTFPPELLTTATGGRSIKRFVSHPWTVLVFIAAGSSVVMLTGFGFWWILKQPNPLPKSSGIVELDFISRLSDLQKHRHTDQDSPERFSELVYDIRSKKQHSAWHIIKALRKRRLELSQMEVAAESERQMKRLPVLHLLPNRADYVAAESSSVSSTDREKSVSPNHPDGV
ncbi:hypothetical protein GCG54_00005155 [Colletotrichum gloeosporioides]|uniref:Uncharacterized protein n=1 Tax=Colletotrichum gloeosporioides TaxID=474922 RepID=A0A8H4FKZ8_COLGL|nr:uncharacterized protein GCG54_00005155 [Colletotrichum gloeosporioides]KAF3805791.1 hypothetical protein GCG54_00005155 [Colletotrichum gloeosporioides]